MASQHALVKTVSMSGGRAILRVGDFAIDPELMAAELVDCSVMRGQAAPPVHPGKKPLHVTQVTAEDAEMYEKSNRRCRSTQEGDHPRRLVPPQRKKIMREEIRGVERTRATSRGYVSCVSYVSEKFPKLQSYSGARNAWPSRATELGCFVVG